MKRLSQPRAVDDSQQKAARELLRVHAERRIQVKTHDGYLTKLFYDHGVPADEIAEAYEVSPRAVYAILERQPRDCHTAGQDCTTCGEVA